MTTDNARPRSSSAALWRRAAVLLSLMAAVVAAYLGIVSWNMRGKPWGCGTGSGCADVLKSRWSNISGVPVGFVACLAYLSLTSVAWITGRSPKSGLWAAILTGVAAMIMTSAMYFVTLQVAVIQAICAWCMVDHSLGVLAAISALVLARRLTPRTPLNSEAQPRDPFAEPLALTALSGTPPSTHRSAIVPVTSGVALALGFVVAQHFFARTPAVQRLEMGLQGAESGRGDLVVTLKNGKATIPSGLLPRLGPSGAPKRLVLLFDYCCPHCREAHAAIRRVQPLAGERWEVLFLPTPLNSACNPAIEETEPRFQDACELARLSLAVWKVRPSDWPAFDEWLFEPELPRSAAEARRHAAALYGEIEVAEALVDPMLDDLIRADVAVYEATGTKVLPVILSPGAAGIAGRTDGEQELLELLKREFGFPESDEPLP